MIELEEPITGERNSREHANQTINNITILSVTALSGRNYELHITSTGLNERKQLTICITAYYLLKLLKSFDGEQLALVEECVNKIEKSYFAEGDIYEFSAPLRFKPEISIKVSNERGSKIRSSIKSLSNNFYAKGISRKYVKLKRQPGDYSSEACEHIPNLLVKSYLLYEEYKKEGFSESFSREICGLDNDMLFAIARLYAKEDVSSNDGD